MNKRFFSSFNFITHLIFFFAGCLAAYISLQIEYFDIKSELDVPSLLLGTLTLLVGYYIASSIQKKLNKNQNQFSFLISKIDTNWNSFNKISSTLLIASQIELKQLTILRKEIIQPLSFLKNAFESFGLDSSKVVELEQELEALAEMVEGFMIANNLIFVQEENIAPLQGCIVKINTLYSETLKIV